LQRCTATTELRRLLACSPQSKAIIEELPTWCSELPPKLTPCEERICSVEQPLQDRDEMGRTPTFAQETKEQLPRSSVKDIDESSTVQELQQTVKAKDQEIAQLRALYQEQEKKFQSFQSESTAELQAMKQRMGEFENMLHSHSGTTFHSSWPSAEFLRERTQRTSIDNASLGNDGSALRRTASPHRSSASGLSATTPSYMASAPSTPSVMGSRQTMPGPCLARNNSTLAAPLPIVGSGAASPSRPVISGASSKCFPLGAAGSNIRVRSAEPPERHGALLASALSPRNTLRTVAGGSVGESFTLDTSASSGNMIVYPLLGTGSQQSLISPRSIAKPINCCNTAATNPCVAGSRRTISPNGLRLSVSASTSAMKVQQPPQRTGRATLANPPGRGALKQSCSTVHVVTPALAQVTCFSGIQVKPLAVANPLGPRSPHGLTVANSADTAAGTHGVR